MIGWMAIASVELVLIVWLFRILKRHRNALELVHRMMVEAREEHAKLHAALMKASDEWQKERRMLLAQAGANARWQK